MNPDNPIKIPEGEDLSDFMHENLKKYEPFSLSYNIAVIRDGQRFLHERPTNPCLGNLTKYEQDSGPDGKKLGQERGCFNKEKPGDLYYNFPSGEVIGIGINLRPVEWWDLADVICEDSHVSEALTTATHRDISGSSGKRVSFVQTKTDIDPNVFWIGLKRLHYVNSVKSSIEVLMKSGLSMPDAYAVSTFFGQSGYSGNFKTNSWKRIHGRNPHRISMGTYKDGFGYSRANCEFIFTLWDIPKGCRNFYNQPERSGYKKAKSLTDLTDKKFFKNENGKDVFDFLCENIEKEILE